MTQDESNPNTSVTILRLGGHGLLLAELTLVNCVVKWMSEIPDSTEMM